jgi:hypothetical protein
VDPTLVSAPRTSAGSNDEDPGAEPLDDNESDREDSERDLLGFYSSSSSDDDDDDDDDLYPTEDATGGDGGAEDLWGDLLGSVTLAPEGTTALHTDLIGLYDAIGDPPVSLEGAIAAVSSEQPVHNPFVNPAVLSMASGASAAGADKAGEESTVVSQVADVFDALLLGDDFAAISASAR